MMNLQTNITKDGTLGSFNFSIWHNGSRFMISGRPIFQVLQEIVSWGDDYETQSL